MGVFLQHDPEEEGEKCFESRDEREAVLLACQCSSDTAVDWWFAAAHSPACLHLGKDMKWLQTVLFQPCPEILVASEVEVIILSRQLT